MMCVLNSVFAVTIAAAFSLFLIDMASAAVPGAGQAAQGCTIGGPQPDVTSLPAGTRLFFRPVMTVQYAKAGAGAAEATYTSPQGDVRAELRDDLIYVNGTKSPATIADRAPLGFRARIETCVYPPGATLPPNLMNLTPDVVLR
jgi:hypothetical protein